MKQSGSHTDKGLQPVAPWAVSRRGFLHIAGVTTAGLVLRTSESFGATRGAASGKGVATVRGAFVYPPTADLREVGYYSWPGSTFDAEGRQREYMDKLEAMERSLAMRIAMDESPLDTEAHVTRFIEDVKASQPDGLLLIPFKKGHWGHVTRIVDETGIPTVVMATLGVLLVDHINQLHRKSGVYLISSLENFEAVENGMKMIRTVRRMKDSRILNVVSAKPSVTTEPHLGTEIRTVPHERFYEAFQRTEITDAVKNLARAYRANAREVVEPTNDDILEAARAYVALKGLLEVEQADAVMMECLSGLKRPHKHVPPCMGFMSLRDEGIPAGCQADLSATLTLMLVQYLFDRPGFQQNASMETESNHYFGAHCTSASKMHGTDAPAEPYILRNHTEAGWGCVPRVLFAAGQAVTLAQYLPGDAPRMIVYSGEVVACPPMPPAGGCRTNVEMTINEVDDVCDVKGMHQVIFYGNYARDLRTFCQLHNIEVVT